MLAQLNYRRRKSQPWTLAVLHEFVVNEGNAWQYTIEEISACYERVTATPEADRWASGPDVGGADSSPDQLCGLTGYLETARRLGQRLADLHMALAADSKLPGFTPEPFSPQYQRSIYQSMRTLISDSFYRLKYALPTVPDDWKTMAEGLFGAESKLHSRFRRLLRGPLQSYRIRCHGDCDLAQVLYLGKDFIYIDFEGSPLQSLGERRIKRSPIRDVVSMMRSFDYAALCSLYGLTSRRGRAVGVNRKEDFPRLEFWTHHWRASVKSAFTEGYRNQIQDHPIGRYSQTEWDVLVDVFTLEKILIETVYELDYRPNWLLIPLIGLSEALGTKSSDTPALAVS